MLANCCNPECEAPFDYRRGRLIRFSWTRPGGPAAEKERLIKHFWLCGKCAGLYVLDFESGTDAKIRPRELGSTVENLSHFSNSA